jgi:hypothetical protein
MEILTGIGINTTSDQFCFESGVADEIKSEDQSDMDRSKE